MTKHRLRIGFAVVIALCVTTLGFAAITGSTTATKDDVPEAPPTENHTVVTESARYGTIIAYAPDGSIAYYNNSHTKYFDVDPVENESMTVEYVAADTLATESDRCRDPPCTRNVVERLNLTTGETTRIVTRYDHREIAGEWHDHVRVNETHVLVADMADDRVSLLDTEHGTTDWAWSAQSEYAVEDGGHYPGDWTHLNDVELLEDGRVMVSLRNQDQIAFIDPETGLNESWTLGADGNESIQHEQHNPDYIPEERGGPAVVVADSENGRVAEFQREDGEWTRTWEWSDERMQWPRDADRLPNGNTLITDTNGKRLIEVNPEGEIVWQVELSHPYDAERLETGSESSGGESARALDLDSRGRDSAGGQDYDFGGLGPAVSVVRGLLPSRVVNAIIYVSPTWIGPAELGPVVVTIAVSVAWAGLESWWLVRSLNLGVRSPLYRKDD
ncbi:MULTISPECIES: arylsulfotransferase family protein [Halostella]|uniref:arylsulfotransferase family protein n=1 Tax=Halostella TaxID=1843185 RepID=UPI001F04F19A|nr:MULTISPECIES: arylsulfotransferase family protein [Halostella]